MSSRRKSRQGNREITVSVPPFIWFLMFFGGIGAGFIFGVGLIITILLFFAYIFTSLASLMGSIVTVAILIIILYICRGFLINFSAFFFGLIIGVVLAIIWVNYGFWSPVEPATIPEVIKLVKYYG